MGPTQLFTAYRSRIQASTLQILWMKRIVAYASGYEVTRDHGLGCPLHILYSMILI